MPDQTQFTDPNRNCQKTSVPENERRKREVPPKYTTRSMSGPYGGSKATKLYLLQINSNNTPLPAR